MRKMGRLFNEESDNLIVQYMKEYEQCHDRFVKISKKIPKYSPKQISYRWRHYLDPRLCHEPLRKDEKIFVIKRVQNQSNVIHWKDVLEELEKYFGRRHAENKIKNFWNSRMRRESKLSKHSDGNFLNSIMRRRSGKSRSKAQKQKGYNLVPSLNQNHSHTRIAHESKLLEPLFVLEPKFNLPYQMSPVF